MSNDNEIDRLAKRAGSKVELEIETTPFGYAAIIAGLQKVKEDKPEMREDVMELIHEIERGNFEVDRLASEIGSRVEELQGTSDIDFGMVPDEDAEEV